MRDAEMASGIPVDTPVVAGYGDGMLPGQPWSSADWARFPNAIKLVVVLFPQHVGDILDIENGAASPADAPGWCDRFSRPGRRAPSLYVNRSNWAAVRAAVGARSVDYWVATLDGTQDVPGAVAVQYVDVGPYDESVVLDPSWVRSEAGMWQSEALSGVFDATGVSPVGTTTVYIKALDAAGFVGSLVWTQALDGTPARVDGVALNYGAHFHAAPPAGLDGGYSVVPAKGFEYARYCVAALRSVP